MDTQERYWGSLARHWVDDRNFQYIEDSLQVAAVLKRYPHSSRVAPLRKGCVNAPKQKLADEHCLRQGPVRDGGLGMQVLECPRAEKVPGNGQGMIGGQMECLDDRESGLLCGRSYGQRS